MKRTLGCPALRTGTVGGFMYVYTGKQGKRRLRSREKKEKIDTLQKENAPLPRKSCTMTS